MEGTIYQEIVDYCANLVSTNGARTEIQAGMEDIYLMRDTPEDVAMKALGPSIALVKDPGDRNAIIGGRRLLTATDPIVNVPFDANDAVMQGASEKIERAAAALLAINDKVIRKPLHYNASLSALLYDEIHIQIVSTADMLEWAKGASPAALARAKRLSELTPYLFKIYNPRTGYPEWDDFGLRCYHRRTTVTVGSVLDAYGKTAKALFDTAERSPSRLDQVTLCDYWDTTYRCVWVEGYSTALVMDEHKLPFVPFVCVTAEGSDLFANPEDQREPFLFTEYQSGMYKRRNEMGTALFTNVRTLGLTPMFTWHHADPNAERPPIKRDGLISYIDEGEGEYRPLLSKGIVDDSMQLALNITERKGEESTMYKTTLGQNISNAPFSLQAMLSQLGRLPLETVRSMTGRALADALEIAFAWWHEDGGAHRVYNARSGVMAELKGNEIADNLTLEVSLDVSLPQDMMQQASVFNSLYQKVPTRWLYEKLLKLGRADETTKELITEQFLMAQVGKFIQEQMAPPQPPPQQQAPSPMSLPPEMAQMGAMSEAPQFEQQPEGMM